MKISSLLGVLLLTVMVATGCATAGSKMASSSKQVEFEKALSQAKANQKRANSVGGEWRDTDKLIKKAEVEAKVGDLDKAIEFAKQAAFQGERGYHQAMEQKNAGPRF
jgi:hypothetical protein